MPHFFEGKKLGDKCQNNNKKYVDGKYYDKEDTAQHGTARLVTKI